MQTSAKPTQYHIVSGTTHDLPDVAEFISLLNTLNERPTHEARRLFDEGAEIVVTRAPGRLDLMGGIADYSGSLVLQLPIAEATLVALQRDPSRALKIISLSPDATQTGREVVFEMPLADFEHNGKLIEYEAARAYFERDATRHWAAYAAGVFLVLMREREARFDEGARLLISSHVPEGKGVSSSAALEVAVMSAVVAAYDIEIEKRELALLCQRVENFVVGAPCGVMDQMTAACGERNQLLALLCQPAELLGTVSIPRELAVWGFDSGVRHSVGAGDYGSVRTGAFMGYRIIAELANLSVEQELDSGMVKINDYLWRGYLANLTPSEFEQSYAVHLPEQMQGADFLTRYTGTTDAVTRVAPERCYAVRQSVAHAIYEHFRVRAFAELLSGEVNERQRELLGELMYQSHASYSACGLGSKGTDLLVSFVREAGAAQGLYGAKITGGGSGGTVAVLGKHGADASMRRVAEKYASATGYQPIIFSGSSPGSAAFGHLRLKTPNV